MADLELEETLVAKLRSGDESAFASLVDELHSRLLVLARTMTSSPALAEDIVQETWLAVIRGLRGFEGRSSLRTWIFAILIRRGRTLAAREARNQGAPLPVESGEEESPDEWKPGGGRVGLWEGRPVPWGLEDPAAAFQAGEALEVIQDAIAGLRPLQRQVLVLRDIEDVSAIDVCNILKIRETNQRVLLHRARARIRLALDQYVRRSNGQERERGASPVRTRVDLAGEDPSRRSMAARGIRS